MSATIPHQDAVPALPVTLAGIRAAAAAIAGAVVRTPTRHSRTLSGIAGCEIYLKFENRQFTASFKERGALNRLLALSPEERRRGVVAMSAGNHAQGVAYHAGRLGIPATIVMPEFTPFTKVRHTRDFGAEVLLEGASLTESAARARQVAERDGKVFVHPYDDPLVIAGQGTLALEMLEDFPDLDAIVAPVGGGGLISGIAIAAKGIKPAIDIYGVQTELYPAMREAVKRGSVPVLASHQTIAEGIAVKEPGEITRAIVAALVADIFVVSEPEIEHALAMILEIEKTVIEGAAAAAFAAVLAHPGLFAGRKVGIVMSGGNIDMRLLSVMIMRELMREGRILTLEIQIEDRPGQLARVAAIIGEAGGNILEVSHNRLLAGTPAKGATLGVVVEARDSEHANAIRRGLQEGGFSLVG